MSGETGYAKLFRLDGKTALVTGGTGILGRHFCSGLAENGANVVIVDQDKTDVEEFAAHLAKKYHVKTLGVACDLSKENDVEKMVAQVWDLFNGIDILHNNAASKGSNIRDFFEPSESFPMKAWREVMSVNVDGLFLVLRAVGSRMAVRGSGSIIQTGSIYGVAAPDQRIYEGSNYMGGAISSPAVYSASKAAVVGLTKYFASLWGARNVRVNTLIPGGVESGQNAVFTTNYSRRVPMGRMARAEEMVGPLIFLSSDASSYITGQEIIVDGGLTCW
jgi:NAD(P)-dependent dehydrogenase (short-subunit alcohol dehydrogenase family)